MGLLEEAMASLERVDNWTGHGYDHVSGTFDWPEKVWENIIASEYVPLHDDMNVDDTQVPLAGVDYPWDGEAIPSYDAHISPVREPTPGSTSRSRTPAPQVGVRTQSNQRRLVAAVQPLEPTESVQYLISAFTAQGASSTSASNDDPSTEVAKVLKDMGLIAEQKLGTGERKRAREMAVQAGIGLSRILLICGAGYTGTIVLRNGKMSDILGELQKLVKRMESSEDGSNTDSDSSDAIAAQIRRLGAEIRMMGNSRQITVLNAESGQMGNLSALVMPAVALGTLGYGYMWWKGLSFSDLMYVTKKGMASAVSNMTKHLEKVSAALETTKKHLTQRIMNLDGKLDDQKEMSKLIKNEVTDVRTDLSRIGIDLNSLHQIVTGLDDKIFSLEEKQDFANAGVWYLCNFIGQKDKNMTDFLQALPKPASKARGYLGFTETPSVMGLMQIADTLGNKDKSVNNTFSQHDARKMDRSPKNMTRSATIKS
ncbi:hypothetical protein GIB67_033038 [Kingdonia uniflora]|uniref:DUF1664 domain-containing protein n=1 Tax=Kingdonia uniflora TaxID=39325 RepID=A0A7J7MYS5_9MAGN|nr:hypothetical protein GIB67_033038 [Kingdonia uniflora]